MSLNFTVVGLTSEMDSYPPLVARCQEKHKPPFDKIPISGSLSVIF